MILIKIGVVKVVGLVFFEFVGKFDGMVVCVLIINVFLVDLMFVVKCEIIVVEINEVVKVVLEGVM